MVGVPDVASDVKPNVVLCEVKSVGVYVTVTVCCPPFPANENDVGDAVNREFVEVNPFTLKVALPWLVTVIVCAVDDPVKPGKEMDERLILRILPPTVTTLLPPLADDKTEMDMFSGSPTVRTTFMLVLCPGARYAGVMLVLQLVVLGCDKPVTLT